jgi:hypothetical protein
MKKYYFLLICFLSIHQTYSGTTLFINQVQSFVEDLKYRALYYKPYAVAGGIASLGIANPSLGLYTTTAATIYALYAWKSGLNEIKALRKKYSRAMRPVDYWNEEMREDEQFLFCRWRQQDNQMGDGYYWPTAWWMEQDSRNVQYALMQDIHAGRIVIKEGARVIKNLTPTHVINAIDRELRMLNEDKKLLKKYTDVYQRINQPEEFAPDTSYWRILWPNYNRASRLFIEIVIMMQRLEVLRTIVANIKIQAGGNGWPRI